MADVAKNGQVEEEEDVSIQSLILEYDSSIAFKYAYVIFSMNCFSINYILHYLRTTPKYFYCYKCVKY